MDKNPGPGATSSTWLPAGTISETRCAKTSNSRPWRVFLVYQRAIAPSIAMPLYAFVMLDFSLRYVSYKENIMARGEVTSPGVGDSVGDVILQLWVMSSLATPVVASERHAREITLDMFQSTREVGLFFL